MVSIIQLLSNTHKVNLRVWARPALLTIDTSSKKPVAEVLNKKRIGNNRRRRFTQIYTSVLVIALNLTLNPKWKRIDNLGKHPLRSFLRTFLKTKIGSGFLKSNAEINIKIKDNRGLSHSLRLLSFGLAKLMLNIVISLVISTRDTRPKTLNPSLSMGGLEGHKINLRVLIYNMRLSKYSYLCKSLRIESIPRCLLS